MVNVIKAVCEVVWSALTRPTLPAATVTLVETPLGIAHVTSYGPR